MNQKTLLRFCEAMIRDGRPEALSLGRVAFFRYDQRRFASAAARTLQERKERVLGR